MPEYLSEKNSTEMGEQDIDEKIISEIREEEHQPVMQIMIEGENKELALETRQNDTKQCTGFRQIIHWSILCWNYIAQRNHNIHVLGMSILLLFMGYMPLQALATIRWPRTGSYHLAVTYAVYGVNSFFAPCWMELLSPEICIPVAGIFMLIYPMMLLQQNSFGILIGAGSHGFGIGMLWPAAGRIIAAISTDKDEGTNTGIYQTYYRAAAGIGGLMYAAMNAPPSQFDSPDEYRAQYGVFATAEGLGVFVGFLLVYTYRKYMCKRSAQLVGRIAQIAHAMHTAGDTEIAIQMGQSVHSHKFDIIAIMRRIGDNFCESIRLIFSKEFLPLAAIMLTSTGLAQAFYTSSFNSALAALSLHTQGASWLGWFNAIGQGFAIIAATLSGLVVQWARCTYSTSSRRIKYPFYIGMTCSTMFYGLSILCVHFYKVNNITADAQPGEVTWSNYFVLLFFTCLCYWFGLMFLDVSLYVVLIGFFGPVLSSAFSVKVFVEAIGHVIGFASNPFLGSTFSREYSWEAILLSLSLPTYIYFIFGFHPPHHYAAFPTVRAEFVPNRVHFDAEQEAQAANEAAMELDGSQQQRVVDVCDVSSPKISRVPSTAHVHHFA